MNLDQTSRLGQHLADVGCLHAMAGVLTAMPTRAGGLLLFAFSTVTTVSQPPSSLPRLRISASAHMPCADDPRLECSTCSSLSSRSPTSASLIAKLDSRCQFPLPCVKTRQFSLHIWPPIPSLAALACV
eukprot:1905821-Rhodomonas_salina.3